VANTAYGRGAYGINRYGGWPGGAGRPFGIGPYGTGPYSRYGNNIYEIGGSTGLTFTPSALPHLTMQCHAASAIVFAAWTSASQLTFNPTAVSGLVFSLTAPLETTWQPTPCCRQGTWGVIRLETIP
jgi:hypothetical protein